MVATAGFCTVCGLPVNKGICPDGHEAMVSKQDLNVKLPPASKPRRLLGSGIEYVAYLIFAWLIMILDAISIGLAGVLSLLLVAAIFLRDFKAGLFSISKRVGRMRVVDHRTGRPASNVQALMRNGYYLTLLAITLLPYVDAVVLLFFKLFVALDVLMILTSPGGRRLGDLLAGTQVVEEKV